MIRYTSQKQLSIEGFRTPFQLKLDPANRWVKLSHLIPWDELASIYHTTLNTTQGAPAVDARIVIGAMMIKHKQKLDDREAIEYIRENPYVQYFLGLRTTPPSRCLTAPRWPLVVYTLTLPPGSGQVRCDERSDYPKSIRCSGGGR